MSAPAETVRTLREFAGSGWIDDGYEFMGAGEAEGWRPIAGWGQDGWDLGDWPYVVVLFREAAADRFQRAIYVEGDITIETYATLEERTAATDETAAFYLRNEATDVGLPELEGWQEGQPVPERLRGPYRSRRLVP